MLLAIVVSCLLLLIVTLISLLLILIKDFNLCFSNIDFSNSLSNSLFSFKAFIFSKALFLSSVEEDVLFNTSLSLFNS